MLCNRKSWENPIAFTGDLIFPAHASPKVARVKLRTRLNKKMQAFPKEELFSIKCYLSVGLVNKTNFIPKKVSKRRNLLLKVKREGFHYRKAFCTVTPEGCELSFKGFSRVTRWSLSFRVRVSKIKSVRTTQSRVPVWTIFSRGRLGDRTRKGRILEWNSRDVLGLRTLRDPKCLCRRRGPMWFS